MATRFSVIDFGGNNGGLGTVGYTLYDAADGTLHTARATAGVTELGSSTGVYSVSFTLNDEDSVSVLWDTGGGSPEYKLDESLSLIVPVDSSFELNVYKAADFIDAYSKDGSNSDPIFDWPPEYFTPGDYRDIPLFLRNDGTLTLNSITIRPFDKSGADETAWVQLATTQAGLDIVTPGDPLAVGTLAPGASFAFWERVTVAEGASVGDKTDLVLAIDAI